MIEHKTHDFGDGMGEIPAHRHLNPDGLLGYWIPDTWNVGPDKFVYLINKPRMMCNEFNDIEVLSPKVIIEKIVNDDGVAVVLMNKNEDRLTFVNELNAKYVTLL